jgi:hypothetical protein
VACFPFFTEKVPEWGTRGKPFKKGFPHLSKNADSVNNRKNRKNRKTRPLAPTARAGALRLPPARAVGASVRFSFFDFFCFLLFTE